MPEPMTTRELGALLSCMVSRAAQLKAIKRGYYLTREGAVDLADEMFEWHVRLNTLLPDTPLRVGADAPPPSSPGSPELCVCGAPPCEKMTRDGLFEFECEPCDRAASARERVDAIVMWNMLPREGEDA